MKKFLLLGIILLSLPANVGAIPINGVFCGHFDTIHGPDDLLNEIGVGTQFTGAISYESDSPIVYENGPDEIYYMSDNFSIEYTIFGATGTHQVTGFGSGSVNVWNDYPPSGRDALEITAWAPWNGSIAGYTITEPSYLYLIDSSGTAINDASLPQSINMEDFSGNSVWLTNVSLQNGFELSGTFDSFMAQPVPAPPTILLLGSGLVGLAGLRKRFGKSGSTSSANMLLL